MMRIWNPSEFKIGKGGRSNCPKWRGQDYPFQSNEVKEVSDPCGRWLIRAHGDYGLVSLPDRNVVTDPVEYDKATVRLRISGIQQLYKWAVRVVAQWRAEAKKCIDAREAPPKISEFVRLATRIQKRYRPDVELSDPSSIEDQQIMREILGGVEHDSDKLLDQALTQELIDKEVNRQQYVSRDNEPVKVNIPGTPTKPNEITPEAKSRAERVKSARNKKKAVAKKTPPAETQTMAPPNLDDGVVIDDGGILDGGDIATVTGSDQGTT